MNYYKTKTGSSSLIAFVLIGIVGLIFLTYYLVSTNTIPGLGDNNENLISIETPNGIIQAIVATSTDDQEKGLGNRESIPKDRGMLFAFPDAGNRGFWMQDMIFPIDMVWINEDKTVAGIISNIATSTYPDIYLPLVPVMYVLELNAGTAENFGIATGTLLQFVI